jgi:hypothetical protein
MWRQVLDGEAKVVECDVDVATSSDSKQPWTERCAR